MELPIVMTIGGFMKHQGGCHCGKVRFEADLNLSEALSCNCSICLKRGSLLEFQEADKFKLLSGEDSLTDYLFNKKVIHHMFCKTCGILPFGRADMPDGKKMVAINVRCVDDIDINKLKINHFDGKHL